MEARGSAGSGKRKAPHAGYDHDDNDFYDDVDEDKKLEIFCALISSTRDHILKNINIVNGGSTADLLIHSHWAAAPNNKKMKTAVDVHPGDCSNNKYKAPNILICHRKAAAGSASSWHPSFQREDFIKVDGDNKIQSASGSTRSPLVNTSMIMTTRPPPPPTPPPAAAAAASASPPPLMMVKQPNADNKLSDHHPKDALDLKLSL